MSSISSRARSRSKLKQQKEATAAISFLLNLPEEVQYEIFLKLPGNSILSLRCVCKILYNQLYKPSFIKNRLNHAKTKNPKLLFFRTSKRTQNPAIYTIPMDYASVSSAQECIQGAVLLNYPFQSKNFGYFHKFLGSCDGLVCSRITEERPDMRIEYFSIMNPLTKEFKEFKKPQVPKIPFGSVTYGFGYDHNINDYKLVMISDYECAGCLKIDVYRVKSDSWTSDQGNVDYTFPSEYHGLFFNEALHWLGTTTTREASSVVIVSFDIHNHSMVDMPLPEHIIPPIDFRGNMFADVGLWGDCIGVALTWRSVRIDMWVMQEYGVKESWSRRFTITEQPWFAYSFWKPLWCYENGEFLIEKYDEQLALYYPTTERVRSVVVNEVMDNREIYVETIVSIGSGTYLGL